MSSISIYGLKCRVCHFQAVFGDDPSGAEELLSMSISELTCPKCGYANVAYLVDLSGQEVELAVCEMRRAFTGFGLPDEQVLSKELLHELFTEVGVESVTVEPSPMKRVLIRNIVFKDGRCVWLAPSGFGVAAFKVTRRSDASSDIHEAEEST